MTHGNDLDETEVQTPLSSSSGAPQKVRRPALRRFIRRVATAQDRTWTHKINGSANLLTSVALVSYAIFKRLETGEWIFPPNTVYIPLLTVWGTSSFITALSGAVMALRYRRHDRSTRNVFIGSSNAMALGAWMAWWISPCFPSSLSSHLLSTIVMTPPILFGVHNVFTTLRDADALITKRRDKLAAKRFKAAKHRRLIWIRDFMIYIMPIVYGLPFFIASPAAGVVFDRETFVSMCAQKDGLLALIVYALVLTNLNIGLGNLAVTLRDKRLIQRLQEMAILSGSMSFTLLFIAFALRPYM